MSIHRVNAPLPEAAARAAVSAIENAVAGGAIYPLARGQVGRSALVDAARALNLTPGSMRNRLLRAENLYGLRACGVALPPPAKEAGGSKAKPAPVDDKALVGLRDENAELRKKLRDAVRDDIDADAIRSILGTLGAAPAQPPAWLSAPRGRRAVLPEVPVTIWSDWHNGETVARSETSGVNEFSPEVCERRVKRLVESTIDLCKNHGPALAPGIVINLLGDFVSGALHPELAKTDAEEVIPAVLRTRDLMVAALDKMISAFGQVYCPCVSGNHGRQTPKPEFKRYVYKNWDWLIYQMLLRHYADNPNIVLDVPDTNEVLFRVYGQRYLAMHGDMLGVKGGDGIIGSIGPIMRGAVKVGNQSRALGQDFDVLLMGHWHQQLWLPGAIVSNTLKGFDEYAARSLRASPSTPSQPLWFVHPTWGRTAHRDIFLEDPKIGPGEGWVSFRGAR